MVPEVERSHVRPSGGEVSLAGRIGCDYLWAMVLEFESASSILPYWVSPASARVINQVIKPPGPNLTTSP